MDYAEIRNKMNEDFQKELDEMASDQPADQSLYHSICDMIARHPHVAHDIIIHLMQNQKEDAQPKHSSLRLGAEDEYVMRDVEACRDLVVAYISERNTEKAQELRNKIKEVEEKFKKYDNTRLLYALVYQTNPSTS